MERIQCATHSMMTEEGDDRATNSARVFRLLCGAGPPGFGDLVGRLMHRVATFPLCDKSLQLQARKGRLPEQPPANKGGPSFAPPLQTACKMQSFAH